MKKRMTVLIAAFFVAGTIFAQTPYTGDKVDKSSSITIIYPPSDLVPRDSVQLAKHSVVLVPYAGQAAFVVGEKIMMSGIKGRFIVKGFYPILEPDTSYGKKPYLAPLIAQCDCKMDCNCDPY